MPYLNCPTCHLTVYSAASWAHIDDCPRCGARLGDPASLFREIRRFQRSIGDARPQGPKRPAVGK
jgi:hypothetical protein